MTYEEIFSDIKSDRVKKVIIDTDTYNEMDDQYAIAYALGSDRINVVAINAAGFYNMRSENFADGMEKSYEEIHRVLKMTKREGTCEVFRGASKRITEDVNMKPVDNPASRNIIKVAHESDELVYILATGCITNVTSAILMDPTILDNIFVIWLGGHCLEYPDLGEFNLYQDYRAGQLLINSGVKMLLLPAVGDVGHGTKALLIRREGMNAIKGDSECAVFFRETLPEEFVGDYYEDGIWERTIWDIAAPAALSVPEAFTISEITAPVFGDNQRYAFDATRHKILYMEKLNPEVVFADTFACISKLG